MQLPFLSVGNLLTVMAFELISVRGADVWPIIGVVGIGFVICGEDCFEPFPTITRRTAVVGEIDRRLLID